MSDYHQLPLQLELRENHRFANFFIGRNAQLVHALKQALDASQWQQIYFWGNQASGKTHLLQACCHALDERSATVGYFPLLQCRRLSTELLEGVEKFDMLCLDDIDAIVGIPHWEEAIFDLCNRIQERQGRLIMTGHHPVKSLDLTLQDLTSRIASSLIFQLHTLAEQDKLAWLQHKAEAKGLKFSKSVGQFLLTHYWRDMPHLLQALDLLDKASLSQKKPLSIPLVKKVLLL